MPRWEVPGFLRGWFQGSFQDFFFLFPMLINEMKEQGVFKIFLHDCRDRKILLRSNASC